MGGDPLLRLAYRVIPPSLHRRAAELLALMAARRVCDVGGGAGHLARALERVGYAPSLLVLVDPDPGLLGMAPGRVWVERVIGVAERLPLRSDACDTVVFHDALHHFHEPGEAVDEAMRAARCILVDDIDVSRAGGRLVRALERIAGYPARFYTAKQLASMLEARGLEIRHLEQPRGMLPVYRVIACRPRGGGPD